MAKSRDILKDFFFKPPLPHTAFQISSRYLSGVTISASDRRVKNHFILPLPGKAIQPSFNKKNISDEGLVKEKIQEGVSKNQFSDKKIACLLPESCLKVFVFSSPSLPSDQEERKDIVLWSVKKQMPRLPDDVRISFDVCFSTFRPMASCNLFCKIFKSRENIFSRSRH